MVIAHMEMERKVSGDSKPFPSHLLPPNPWGLYQVHGNVYEWVEDCAHENYVGAPPDGSSAWVGGKCDARILRGGSWVNAPQYLRAAHRGNSLREDANTVGLRVARTIAP
jgi:formylglycine-generating enzyme required for sulfatase activity